MPRGKNYVNQNKGMTILASKITGGVSEMCFYGTACTRKDCIYKHPKGTNTNTDTIVTKKSNDPCMAYLAGLCTFNAKTCMKRHPSEAEKQLLIEKYSQIPCRYGNNCKTRGCLYVHNDSDSNAGNNNNNNLNYNIINNNNNVGLPSNLVYHPTVFPPLSSSTTNTGRTTTTQQPTTSTSTNYNTTTTTTIPQQHNPMMISSSSSNSMQSFQQQQQQQQIQPQPQYNNIMQQPPPPPPTLLATTAPTTAAGTWGSQQQKQQPSSLSSPQSSPEKLNINAKEFVPRFG